MTNQSPTPEQMLELAKICEPDKEWVLIGEDVYRAAGNYLHYKYTPHTDNPAQLMQVVFTLAKKVDGWEIMEYSLTQHLAAKDKKAILNLAVEVLL